MADAKIDITVGTITFSAEGEQGWVSDQLDKLFKNAKNLSELPPPTPSEPKPADGGGHTPIPPDSNIAGKPLAMFLKEKNATSKQVLKFLATAIWLESKGRNRLSTSDVAQALRDANQSKLNNASDSLSQNIKKGFCEKDGGQFFVTTEGKGSM
jgi:hypothetical protein